MPNRNIKESVLTSRNLNKLSIGAEVFFYRLTVIVDDFGVYYADAQRVRPRCFPLRLDEIYEENIEIWLEELIVNDLVILYEKGEDKYFQFINWTKYQYKRAKNPKYPLPDGEGVKMLRGIYTPPDLPVVKEKAKSKPKSKSKSKPKIEAEKKEYKVIKEVPEIKLYEDQYIKLVNLMGEKEVLRISENIILYEMQHNKKYNSHYATALLWYKQDLEKKEKSPPVSTNTKRKVMYGDSDL